MAPSGPCLYGPIWPHLEIDTPGQAIGRNTEEAMQSGILFGYAALTDGLVRRLAAEMACAVAVVATGGLAGTVSVHATTIETVEPNLTLEGLRLIYLRNL